MLLASAGAQALRRALSPCAGFLCGPRVFCAPVMITPGAFVPPDKFAVVEIGCRQFKLVPGDTVIIDSLDVEIGETISFDKVLMVGHRDWTVLGRPVIENARVTAWVQQHILSPKYMQMKYRRRKNIQGSKGFRHPRTIVRVAQIFFQPPDDALKLVEEEKARYEAHCETVDKNSRA
eukprot:gnl/Spiro4/16737_TR9010_c0_g1_i1.p1 gnl/Spiro4/16737_TR9010_c0_g1~~gnl/Spiro4/16737_TR9010_c0_g1_i1.p1  ORF type:complete len:177 (-),score=25.24 gnl/Spiro4/16737_TR9010_c0_g1_i1:40-570(-)